MYNVTVMSKAGMRILMNNLELSVFDSYLYSNP